MNKTNRKHRNIEWIDETSLKRSYEKNGYILLPNIMNEIDSENLMDEVIGSVENGREDTWEQKLRLQTLMIETPEATKALDNIKNCVNKIGIFDNQTSNKKLLQEFASLTNYPGCKAQCWHRDSTKHDAVLMTAFMNVYETTLECGALQVVKGSHKKISWLTYIDETQVQTITLPEKSLVLMDSRLIHRGGANKTKKEIRPVVYATFGQDDLEEPGYYLHKSLKGKYSL